MYMSEGGEIQDWGDEPPKEAGEISHREPQKPQMPRWVSTIPHDAMAALFKTQPGKTITEPSAKTEEILTQTPITPPTETPAPTATPTAPETPLTQTSIVPPSKTLK